MKRIKRTLAALLTVVLTLALLGEAVFADNSEQPVWPEEGAIQLSKSAAAVEGKENTWEVTLGIQGKNYKTTSDVVLVIDNSNSMYDNSRMAKTKAAANAFVDTLLTEESTTRIALVVYNLTETHTGFYTYENKAALKSKINAIEQDNDNGGTFTQLGLHTARTLLNSAESTGQNKSIVLLSDGEPTASYRIGGSITCTEDIEFKDYTFFIGVTKYATSNINWATAQINCNYNKVDGNGEEFVTDAASGLEITGCKHASDGGDDYITHGIATIWESNQAKADGTTIYSVALQVGTNGEQVLKACATNPTKGYFAIGSSTNIETALKDAFTSLRAAFPLRPAPAPSPTRWVTTFSLSSRTPRPSSRPIWPSMLQATPTSTSVRAQPPMTPRPVPFTGRSATSASRISPS